MYYSIICLPFYVSEINRNKLLVGLVSQYAKVIHLGRHGNTLDIKTTVSLSKIELNCLIIPFPTGICNCR